MIINGSLKSNKTELLINEYISLINKGISQEQILFITLNAYKKNKVKKYIKAFLPNHVPDIQTFSGLCYNYILNNWALLQNNINTGEKRDVPILCGLEVSQNIFTNIINQVNFKDYNSKINLIHQLLRRHTLIVNNNLTDEEIKNKSEILNEAFAPEAQQALELYKMKTLELKAFDYIRQQSLFKYLYEKTEVFNKIKYIFIDDMDEQTQACYDFFEHLRPNLENYFVGIDEKGTSRYGYLCGNINAYKNLKNFGNELKAKEINLTHKIQIKNFSKRMEMIKYCISEIKKINSTEDISIITPVLDNQLKYELQNEFNKLNIDYQFISGNEKLSDDNFISAILSFLRIINNIKTKLDDVQNIFNEILKIPVF